MEAYTHHTRSASFLQCVVFQQLGFYILLYLLKRNRQTEWKDIVAYLLECFCHKEETKHPWLVTCPKVVLRFLSICSLCFREENE